jgi:hypothetical protein
MKAHQANEMRLCNCWATDGTRYMMLERLFAVELTLTHVLELLKVAKQQRRPGIPAWGVRC